MKDSGATLVMMLSQFQAALAKASLAITIALLGIRQHWPQHLPMIHLFLSFTLPRMHHLVLLPDTHLLRARWIQVIQANSYTRQEASGHTLY